MTHSPLRKAIDKAASLYGVRYQSAKTRVQKAIDEGLFREGDVVRDRVHQDVWHEMGFETDWQWSSRHVGIRSGVAVRPAHDTLPVRDSRGEPPLSPFDQARLNQFLAGISPTEQLVSERKRPSENAKKGENGAAGNHAA